MSFQNLNVQEFKEKIESDAEGVVLDVRTPAEIAEINIPNHAAIDFLAGGFQEKVADLDKTKTYYIYCRSGGRSANACQLMSQMGFEKLYNLLGGITAWEAAGYND